MITSRLTLSVAATLGSGLVHLPPQVPGQVITCLPSSLKRNDLPTARVRDILRQQGINSHLLLPDSTLSAVFGRMGGNSRSSGDKNSTGASSSDLPERLLSASTVWAIIDMNVVAGRGPYALDLLAHYANPVTRLRIIGSRNRAERAIDLLQKRPIVQFVMCYEVPSFVLVATTSDPIIAELVSLALVDEDLTRDHEVVGPWEDDLVQRATERDLGVRLPSDINVSIKGEASGLPTSLIQRLCHRIGISIR